MATRRPTAGASTITQLGGSTAPARARAARLEPLVGLRRERAHLEKMLRDALAGYPAVTGIHGLVGSGKTSLVETMIAHAAGFSVVRLPPAAGIDEPNDLWRTAFEVFHEHLSSATDPSGRREGGTDSVHESIVTAVRAACRQGDLPALIVFEDCQSHQVAFAEALATAVLDPELGATAVLVVTWHDEPDGTSWTFARPDFPAHRLQPLTLEQAADYLTERIGKRPESSVLSELWRGTGGNPAALLSACSHLSDDELDGLIPVPDPLPIGDDLAGAFGGTAAALEGDARTALTVAAAAHMSVPVLNEALAHAGLSLDALRPALEAGFAAILGDRLEFVHPLCRAAAFEGAGRHSSSWRPAGPPRWPLPGPGCPSRPRSRPRAASVVARRHRRRPLQ